MLLHFDKQNTKTPSAPTRVWLFKPIGLRSKKSSAAISIVKSPGIYANKVKPEPHRSTSSGMEKHLNLRTWAHPRTRYSSKMVPRAHHVSLSQIQTKSPCQKLPRAKESESSRLAMLSPLPRKCKSPQLDLAGSFHGPKRRHQSMQPSPSDLS